MIIDTNPATICTGFCGKLRLHYCVHKNLPFPLWTGDSSPRHGIIFLWPVLIISCHLNPGSPGGQFSPGFPIKILRIVLSRVCSLAPLSHAPLFDHRKSTLRIMKILTKQFFPASCCFVLLALNHLPQRRGRETEFKFNTLIRIYSIILFSYLRSFVADRGVGKDAELNGSRHSPYLICSSVLLGWNFDLLLSFINFQNFDAF
jgi:hypothetical protein